MMYNNNKPEIIFNQFTKGENLLKNQIKKSKSEIKKNSNKKRLLIPFKLVKTDTPSTIKENNIKK
jgi:hypothetical protein